MKTVGYYNGTVAPVDELTVPASDRAVYFGDGVYEAAFARNGIIFALEEHLNRFFNSCRLLRIEPVQTKEELKALFYDLAARFDGDAYSLYWQLSRGSAPRGHAFPDGAAPNLLVMIRPKEVADPRDKRFSLLSVEDRRYTLCHIKTINLIPNILANQAAREAGCDEAVFVRDGFVTEGSHSNIAILKNGVFQTAPLSDKILPGITRMHYIAICRELHVPVIEAPFTLEQAYEADEIMVMASSVHGTAADFLNGRPVGGKAPDLYAALAGAYRQKFLRETEKKA